MSHADYPDSSTGASPEARLRAAIHHAGHLLPAQGPIGVFVHHNTLHAFQHLPFHAAVAAASATFGAEGYLSEAEYLAHLRSGRIRRDDLAAALAQVRAAPPLPRPPEPERTHRDVLLEATGEDPAALIDPILIRLLSAYLDEGIAHWAMPDRELGLWRAFLSLVREAPPLQPSLRGLPPELRRFEEQKLAPAVVVLRALEELGVPEARWGAYLERVLLELPGWAGMVSRLEHTPDDRAPGAPPASLLEYLAVRMTLSLHALRDVARRRLGHGEPLAGLREHALSVAPPARAAEDRGAPIPELDGLDEPTRLRVWQEAYERRHRMEVMGAIATSLRRPADARRIADPRFQVVCCIDDRCCGFRRHFEELSPRHETFGVAGFFGIPIRYRGIDDAGAVSLCPVGVEPAHEVIELPHEEEIGAARRTRRRWWARVTHALRHGTSTMARGMVLTPTLGFLYMLPLVGRVLMPRTAAKIHAALSRRFLPAPTTRLHSPGEEDLAGGVKPLTATEKANRLATTLENMGLVRGFAPLVVILGHGSKSVNNPHQSAYDCGACGGRHGGPNARIFAAMANDPEARAKLRARGIDIPDGTWFLGGLHNTTTDAITLHDEHLVPEALRPELAALSEALDAARKLHAHERCRRFASAPRDPTPEEALAHVEARAEDLSQARPELGHVANSICVVGRRALTRGLFLDRRAFLVSYDPTLDPEGRILERILLAVGPVGAGINLEYYFSRVDNVRYGCGTKLPHNLASLLGVMEGSLGDLRTGLPRQMIEIHEPVRLLVVIEATKETAAALCERQPALRELICNGWIQVACVHPETGEMHRFDPDAGGFEALAPPDDPLPEVDRSADWYAGKTDFVPPALIRAAATKQGVFHAAA